LLKNIISTLFSKGFVAIVNFVILFISSKQLGSNLIGQLSLLILNIAIIQIINEIYTGYALVYFIPKYALAKLYKYGIIWTISCTMVFMILFNLFSLGFKELMFHTIALSFIIIIHSFHMVIILAKEKIKIYNFLNFLQPGLLLFTLVIMLFGCNIKTLDSYIMALYVSFCIVLSISIYQLVLIFRQEPAKPLLTNWSLIFKNGFYNQLANLSHILSNRFNFYLLGNTILVGIFSRSSTLIESVWIISGSVSPIILSHIANSKKSVNNARLTLLLAKLCLVLSIACVGVLYFIPRDFFVFLLGEDFIHTKTVMLYLSPGILFISFSTIISHYFSGLGQQKVLVIANSCGLIAALCVSHYFVSRYQLLGACYSTIISYFVAAVILTAVFMKQNKFNVLDLFKFKNDFKLLQKSNTSAIL